MTAFFYDLFPTPVGPFAVAVDAEGTLVATAFGSLDTLCSRLKSVSQDGEPTRDPSRTEPIRAQVLEYFAGRRRGFDLPLRLVGTRFQTAVWVQLQKIPFGETRTYSELARLLNAPGASRAVGGANGSNPLCLIVPCHRVIGANGSLTGFAFGPEIKRRLLELERHVTASGVIAA